nr:MAG TPA: Sulfhydryl oxidase 1 [Caudoviricetes sp.]
MGCTRLYSLSGYYRAFYGCSECRDKSRRLD